MKRTTKLLSIVLYSLLCGLLMLALYTFSNSNRQQPIPYSEAVSLFEQQQVKSFSTKDKLLTMMHPAPMLLNTSRIEADPFVPFQYYHESGSLPQRAAGPAIGSVAPQYRHRAQGYRWPVGS